MKRNIIMISLVALLAGLVVGCGGGTESKAIDAVESMDTTNAPTLGPVYKEFVVAVLSKDGEKAWGLMSKDHKKIYEDQFKAIDKDKLKEQLEKLKKDEDKPLTGDAPIPQETKDMMAKTKETQIEMIEMKLEAKDAKDFFVKQMSMIMEKAFEIEDEKEESEKEDFGAEFVSEKIDGDKGEVVIKDKKSGSEHTQHFVKEDGDWKIAVGK